MASVVLCSVFLPAWNYWWCVAVLLAGVVSAFLGVLYAQMETDIKRVLAYSSVENMGVIFAAFGCGMLMKASGSSFYMLGFVAALVHAFNHSIMKVLMFMCAGSIMHGTGSKNLELFGGLARKMPYTAVFAFVGSLALAAIPLTNGFTGEWAGAAELYQPGYKLRRSGISACGRQCPLFCWALPEHWL